ncbi:unnamed protein product [Rotaria magnacalcarata]|uniref:C-type lectin domain-containing protein n=2 Tax=Rotaria magnacalcarata TaxID=392030 RepID=A0A816P9Z3_9BILA|nr:unnamed protein product [Rotaria magnacalcarata]CAF1616519.1 unnamed protein product [Rotaria magnacalcarata]CAF2046166.1 unnamed protein product [Rotaria magnacalcarata]CAF3799180.1 unnamed protein product [Rotaria magnacalcarata]CAF3813477.1 unnamed protein product [Rotaria magnacalcarata]
MKFGLLLFLLFVLSTISPIITNELFQQTLFNTDGTLQKLRQKTASKYRNLKTKISNNNNRPYQPPIVISDTTQKRPVNQANTNNITHATINNIYSTSSMAEDYCRDFGPTSSVLLFAYRGSCYSLTNQAVTWSQADNLCQSHFHSTTNKNQGGLALFEDATEFDYIGQIIGVFNQSATEFGAYIGFSYRNQSWLWLNGHHVNFSETPPSVIAPNNLIFPYQQQKPCGKIELLRPNETTSHFGLMQQECTKIERALCKIKVDHCFENDLCGMHGVCNNDGTTFHCECAFLYDGKYCDKYSSEAIQVIAACLFIGLACIAICVCKRSQKYKNNYRKRQIQRRNENSDKYVTNGSSGGKCQQFFGKFMGSSQSSSSSDFKKSSLPPPLPNPRPNITKFPKRHRPKPIMDGLLTFIQSFLTVTVAGISIVYICVQRASSIYDEHTEKSNKNFSTKSYLCHLIGSNNSNQNIIMLPLSIVLTVLLFLIHQTINIDKKKSYFQNLTFPIIVNPFQKSNRFHTIIVFAIISNQLMTLLYEILFSSNFSFHHGILFDLVRRFGLIILYGIRYFPILLSLNIHSFLSTFFTSLFLTFDLLLSVYYEANCINSLTSMIGFKTRPQIEMSRINYLLVRCLPHYVALGHIMARFYTLTLRNFFILCKGNSDRWNTMTNSTYHTTSIEYDNDWYYTKSLLVSKRKSSLTSYYLYAQTLHEEKNCSCIQSFTHLFYKPKAYFRFSLLVLFTYTVSFLVLYYLTCSIIFSSTFTLRIVMNLTGNIIIKLINMTNFNLSIKSLENLSFQNEIYMSCLLSFFIYVIQLLLGLKKYQTDMLDYYRGKCYRNKQDFPSSTCILQKSFHYSGYQVGYLAYGFIMINYFMFITCLTCKLLFIHPLLTKILLKIIAPMVILFALKHVIVHCLTKYFFSRVIRSNRKSRQNIQNDSKDEHDTYIERPDQAIYCDSTGSSTLTPNDDDDDESDLFTLENRHAYFLFVYFNFFFDCFLGIVSCVSRLVKSGIALVLFMPRLDYSIFGRSLETIDNGYTAYTSYLYVEAMHTHPILITFTQIIYMNILEKRRRQKHFLLTDEKQIIEQNRRKCLRFRWFLLVTLMNNLSLISTRRHHQKLTIFRHPQKINERTFSSSLLPTGTVTVNMRQ